MKKTLYLALFILLGALAGDAQNQGLIVYGNRFAFGVTEPGDWRGYTEDAYRYQVNIYFCLGKTNIDHTPVLMHIRVEDKFSDTLQKSLSSDMDKFAKQVKKIEFLDFDLGQLKYEYASKIYLMDDKTTDYLCYIDPDKKLPIHLVFVMHGPKDKCPKYEKDFTSLITSFIWMGSGLKK